MTEPLIPSATSSALALRDINAGDAFRDTLLPRRDAVTDGGYPLWHGWAILDAFLAGAAYARSETQDSPTAKNEGDAALRLLAEVADAMDLSLGDTDSVAKMRPLILARLERTPSAIEQKWIPVGTSDVPAEGHHVLVFSEWDLCKYTSYTRDGKWYHACAGDDSEKYRIRSVTKWMEIP